MFEDIVLKAQGLQQPVTINGFSFPEEILTEFAYLTYERFIIAVFLKDNPKSSTAEISKGTWLSLSSVYNFVSKMFNDSLITRTGSLVKNTINYSYSISLRGFAFKENIKNISEKEIIALNCVIKLKKCTSTEIVRNTGIKKEGIYYLMRILVSKGMLKLNAFNSCKYSYKITSKGRATIANGGVYE